MIAREHVVAGVPLALAILGSALAIVAFTVNRRRAAARRNVSRPTLGLDGALVVSLPLVALLLLARLF